MGGSRLPGCHGDLPAVPDYLGPFHANFQGTSSQAHQLVMSLNMAKCNLGKVNLELMLPVVSPSLHMIRGGAPLEFPGANYVQPCLLAIVAITASVSESLRIH